MASGARQALSPALRAVAQLESVGRTPRFDMHKILDNALSALQTRSENLLGAVAFPAITYLASRVALEWLSRVHSILAMVLAVVLLILIGCLLIGLARTHPTHFPVRVVLSMFAMVVFLGASVCAFLSYFLYSNYSAAYTSTSNTALSSGGFADFYLWYFIDMIPLKVWETLQIQAPIKIGSPLAGLPLLLFRVLVALPVIFLVGRWYKSLSEKKPATG